MTFYDAWDAEEATYNDTTLWGLLRPSRTAQTLPEAQR